MMFDAPPGAQFLKLQASKAPVSWDVYDLDKASAMQHVGIKVEQPWIVVDIDTADQAEKLTKLIAAEGIRCRIMQTTKGRHFWFRVAEPLKNSVRTMTGIGLMVDYRSWGKQSQVVVRQAGQWREWVNDTPWAEIDEIPRWLRPLKQDRFRFYEMGEGDGRNQALYEYQIDLAERGYTQSEAADVIRMINTYVFDKPLPVSELRLVSRTEAYPEPKVLDAKTERLVSPSEPWFVENKNGTKTFLHNEMGNYLIEQLHPLVYRDRIYVYRDGFYQLGENIVLKEIIKLWPESKKQNQSEVMNYLMIANHTEMGDTDQYTVNLKNGRLDLKTGKIAPHDPKYVDFQRVNAAYDPTVYCPALDNMLEKVFCHDLQLYALFEEILGYCLTRNSRQHKLFVFTGDGSNGKSTILKVIRHFIGEDNVSSVSLQGLEDRFKTAELENKLANIGDDIPMLRIKDSSQIKILSAGDKLTVERKNKDPFTLKNYAKLIFSTNKMPNIDDQSDGLGRRMCIIPFDAKFSARDKDFDPNIEDKVLTDEAMTYMLNMAIRGLRRLTRRGKFLVPDKVVKATEAFRIENSNVLTWIDDEGKDEPDFIGMGTKAIYQEYVMYCQQNGLVPRKKTGLTQEIKRVFDIDTSQNQRVNGGQDRIFIRRLSDDET